MNATKFETGDFTKEDCLVNDEFTSDFIDFLKKDTIGKMYLRGFIRESKNDFVDGILKLKKAGDVDSFKEFMNPYIKKLENETRYKYNDEESKWRHCNDIAMMRTTLQFHCGDSTCLLCVFEDRFTDTVNADVFIKNDNRIGMKHWNHIDHCGVNSKLEDYFDRIIRFCK